jgi:hypothetical protein
LEEPKNLRASAPIMPNSCLLAGSALLPDVVHRGAYQLIVTHRATGPNSGGSRQMGGNCAIQGSTAKNAANTRYRHRLGFGRDMAGPKPCQRREPVKDFIILTDFRVAKAPRLGECPAAQNSPVPPTTNSL